MTYVVQGSVTIFFVFVMYFFVYSDRHARAEPGESVDLLTFLDVILSQIYASTQQYSGVFYTSREWDRPKWVWDASDSKWYLNSVWAPFFSAGISRFIFFSVIFLSKHAVVYHFFVPKSDLVEHSALICYGSLLIFGCMLLGSSWFSCLRDLIVDVPGRPSSVGKRVVRLQHVLYALVVAGAYIFPLQMVELRIGLVSILLLINWIQ